MGRRNATSPPAQSRERCTQPFDTFQTKKL